MIILMPFDFAYSCKPLTSKSGYGVTKSKICFESAAAHGKKRTCAAAQMVT